jgi:transcriptional antiterminator NusG
MKKWYVVHTQTGLEEKVKSALENRISTAAAQELVSKVLVPTEQVSEVRSGKRRVLARKFFPGYLLVEMELNEKTYFLIKATPGVTGFIGLGKRPTALGDREIEEILKRSEETKVKPSPKTIFEKGEQVRIIDGPFVNFNGVVEEIHPEKGKLKASVSIFGRATPVELEYWQVEKI